MAGINESDTDEEFLISKVLSNLKIDVATAKSWMIFTKSVYPNSFPVLFQSYKMERDEKNLIETALALSDLIKKFPNEPSLVKELREIADVLSTDNENFLRDVFEKLSEDVKHELMIAVTRNARSVEEHCQLMLLFLKRMPDDKIYQRGNSMILSIVETLLSAENQREMNVPVNQFRKMLVCDALPLVLKVPQHNYKFKLIFQLLQMAIEFYVSCMFVHPPAQDFPIKKDVTDIYENSAELGWKPLLKLFEAAALRYKWNYPEMLISNYNELNLQQLLLHLKKKNKLLSALTNEKHRREEMSGFEEAYFCLVIAFFYYLYQFGRLVHPQLFSNMVAGPYNYVLMEGISFLPDDCPKTLPSDFKRTDKGYLGTDRGYLVVSKCGGQDASLLSPALVTIVECWELLHNHQHLVKEFKSVCTNVKIETWPVFQEFFLTNLIFGKFHREAIQTLSLIRHNVVDNTHKDKIALQIASSYYYLKDYRLALKILFEIILNLSPVDAINPVKSGVAKCPARYTYFMANNNSDILQYCISLLLKLYKTKDKIEDAYRDMALGYMLVLMQYNLENEYRMLQGCIEAIKKAKTFYFPKFFKYIVHVDILEEIAYIATPAGGNVKLDIMFASAYQASKQRAVTKGVNKKDDLKQAFINQMARCYDNLDNLFLEFFKEEHALLLLPLNL